MTSLRVSLDRRQALIGLGALIIAAPAAEAAVPRLEGTGPPWPQRRPDELDSWLAIAPDGKVTAYFGKPDLGQGVDVAIAQIVADELDVPVGQVEVVCGHTDRTVNQGGASGSTALQRGANPLRNAAAEARRLMLEAAAVKLSAPVEQLEVTDGVIRVVQRAGAAVSYGELVGGGAFDHKVEWNEQWGNTLNVTGHAKPKPQDQYRVVGTSVPRRDVEAKVFGKFEYIFDVRLPGMLHGRVLRPPVAGAVPLSVDEASISHIAGARLVRRKDFVGVVAESEWDAIQAARAVKVAWSQQAPPFFPSAEVYDYIRKAPARKSEVVKDLGAVEDALANSAKVVQAEYVWPFQSHASMSPGCGLADVRDDAVTLWTASQKPHANAMGVAKLLRRPLETVRAIWVSGPGSYGRNDAADACADAAVMSWIVGRPVRVQYDRQGGHGWDPKAPASIHTLRAGIDENGQIVAYDYASKAFNRMDVNTAESEPGALLAGMLLGFEDLPPPTFAMPEEAYEFRNRRMAWSVIPGVLPNASPLRTSNLRDPVGPQRHFASECFIDECAEAAAADPVAFRLRHLKNPRHRAVIEAAAKAADWKAGPPGARRGGDGKLATGRGFAYANRGETIVAVVCDVEVDRQTGRIWARRFVVAHECGLIVNPKGLTSCIEGNVVQAVSRALFEETTFDAANVTSIDWATYPVLGMRDAPEEVRVVLIDRKDLPSSGAGEGAHRPVAAAIANAVYDATGVRLRAAPFTPARMRSRLQTS